MRTYISAVLGFSVAFLFGFTTQSAPPRAPTVLGTGTSQVYIHDPYAGGAVPGGVPNVTGKNFSCTASQALGFSDDGGSIAAICVSIATVTANNNTVPATPTGVGSTTTYQFIFDAGFPSIPYTIDSFMGTPIPVGLFGATFESTAGSNWSCGCTEAEGWGNNNFVSTRWVSGGQVVQGTSTSAAGWASTSLYTRLHFIVQQSVAAINSSSEVRHSRETVWRGNSAGAGGWLSQERFGLDAVDGGARVAVGYWNATTAPTATSDPSVITNAVYVGCDQTQATMHICSNDNSGAATCSDLGSLFPCAGTAGGGAAAGVNLVPYDFWLAAAPNGAQINYYLKRLDTGDEISGGITTDLPQNTVQLGWHVYANSGQDNHAVRLSFMYSCNCANQ